MKGKKWYKKVSNWIFALLLVILIPILVINIFIMVQANSNNDKVPSVFGYKPFIVLSGSMETKIHVGDLVITKEINPKTLKKNDVIAFRDDENTVTTHRIIDIVDVNGSKYFVTKGDNNNSQDQNLVDYKDVEGLYIGRIPGIGTMLNELAKPTTIIIVFLGVTVIFALLFYISNRKLKTEEEKEFLEYKKMKKQQEKSKEKDNDKEIEEKEEDIKEEQEVEEKKEEVTINKTNNSNNSNKNGAKKKSSKKKKKHKKR